jgi:hypothetical protein
MGSVFACVLGSYMLRSIQVQAMLGSKDLDCRLVSVGMVVDMVLGMVLVGTLAHT